MLYSQSFTLSEYGCGNTGIERGYWNSELGSAFIKIQKLRNQRPRYNRPIYRDNICPKL